MNDKIEEYLKENKNPEFTQEEVYKLLRSWEYGEGENFFDYNESIINILCLAFWLYGKNYMDRMQLMAFVKTPIYGYDDIFFDEEIGIFKNHYNNSGYKDIDYEFAMYWIMSGLLKDLPTYINRIKETFKTHEIDFEISSDYEEEMEKEIEIAKEIIDNELLKNS